MRLSQRIIKKLKQAILKSFGEVPVYLFGSRVDNNAIGGDIDLAIDVSLDKLLFRQKRVLFKTELLKMGFIETEVDIVAYHPNDPLLAKEIAHNGVRLF